MAHGNPGFAHVVVVEWSLIGIAAGVIAARLNLRLVVQRRRLLTSDYLMCASWLSAILVAALDIKLGVMGALDPDVGELLERYPRSDDDKREAIKILWYSIIPYFSTLYLCKAALLSTYLQIFPTFMRKRRQFLWALIGYTGITYILTIILCIFTCLPIQRNWTLDPQEACSPYVTAVVFDLTWGLHLAGELMIFALPWMVVTGIQMRTALKVGVYFTFLLGLINIFVCVARFILFTLPNVGDSVAFIGHGVDCFIGLIIACLPSLRPYFGSKGGSHYMSNMDDDLKSASVARTLTGNEGLRGPVGPPPVHMPQTLETIERAQLRHYPSLTNSGNDDDLWEERSRSNESDVELMQVTRPDRAIIRPDP